MKFIVTGAAGFIGFHASQRLVAMGHGWLSSFNDFSPLLKKYRLEQLEALGDSLTFEKIDLAERSELEALMGRHSIDGVLHLAAQAGVRYSLENPYTYTRNNVEAFLNILEVCRHHKIQRLSYASSSSVYGGLKTTPFSEEMRVDTPISLYAATKKSNELMAHTYSHLYGFETVGLRFFTVYGPMGRPDMALWLFTDAILSGRPIKVFNHGKMCRDFTYIDDIVSGAIVTLFKDMPERCNVFNLGNNQSEELETMISTLEESLGQKAEREMLPMQPGDVHETYANVDKAVQYLDYAPKTPIAEGIPNFTDWYRNQWLPYQERNA